MKPFTECIPCYAKQMLNVCRIAGISDEKIPNILYESMKIIPRLSLELNPAINSSLSVIEVYNIINDYNPYKFVKKDSNDFALSMYSNLKNMLEHSKDRLLTSLKISVAGNIIDFNTCTEVNIYKSLDEITTKEFDYCDYDLFVNELNCSNNILILGDNAGEIVFDKLLIEQLIDLGKDITYAVKSNYTLNDATIEDAIYVGMDKVARIIETGSDFVGATLKYCSEEFLAKFKEADLIIMKGQANYESLEDELLAKNKSYFLLRAKCHCIAEHLNVNLGDIVFKRNGECDG